jgi:hypothetical protein
MLRFIVDSGALSRVLSRSANDGDSYCHHPFIRCLSAGIQGPPNDLVLHSFLWQYLISSEAPLNWREPDERESALQWAYIK